MQTPVNRVQLRGHLGKDPELMTTGTGKKYIRMSLATNETYTGRNGDPVSETNWHNLVAWGALAERIAASVHKGQELIIEGALKTRSWEDKEGKRRYATEVLLAECQPARLSPAPVEGQEG